MITKCTPLRVQSINRVGDCTIYKDKPPGINYIGFVPYTTTGKSSFFNLSSGVYQINFFQEFNKGEYEVISGVDLVPTLRSAGVMYVNNIETLIGNAELKNIPNITVIVPNFISIEKDAIIANLISIDYEIK